MKRIIAFKKLSRVSACLAGLLAFPAIGGAAEPGWPQPIDDNQIFNFLLFDQLEYRANEGADSFDWDVQGWIGTDKNKLWIKTEGAAGLPKGAGGDAEVQALYSRIIAPFWDIQAGLRYERAYGPGPDQDRVFAVVGFQGLAPYRYEVEPVIFISEDGDISGRLSASYDLLVTQRLILQPRLESNFAIQRVRAYGVGRGINDIQLELRLRYEIKRQFAPYVGVSWTSKLGGTADMARLTGDDINNLALVGGVRLWF